jgi:hypothetical protein
MRGKNKKALSLVIFALISFSYLNSEGRKQTLTLTPTAVLAVTPMPLARLDFLQNINLNSLSLNLDVLRYPGTKFKLGKIENTLFTSSLVTFAALNLADYFSTRQALKYPCIQEANPFMEPFVKSPYVFATIKLGTTVLGYYSMKKLFKKDKKMAWALSLVSNFVLSYVVVKNVQLIHKAQGK